MTPARLVLLTALAMTAFAGNSLLCRAALANTQIDPASFTLVRILSGALTLWIIVAARRSSAKAAGSWPSALALFAYAAGFSFAYVTLPAGTGALLLFGAVQVTMIVYGLARGERIAGLGLLGMVLALSGLVGLLLPGIESPPLAGSFLMLGAGIAWGVYSLRGRGVSRPLADTAGNFLRAAPLAAVTSLIFLPAFRMDGTGVLLAVASGAIASGLGYAVWYSVLPGLKATTAATVQLSVPAIAALAGVILLSEPITLRLVLASVAILGGIALFIFKRKT